MAITTSSRQVPAVSSDTVPAAPPAEVLAEMRRAGEAADRLAASGRALHFSVPLDGRMSITLRDDAGRFLSTLSPGDVLALAADADEPPPR